MNYCYHVKRLPGGFLRVVDLEDDRVEGVWNQEDKRWFDLRGFLDDANRAEEQLEQL